MAQTEKKAAKHRISDDDWNCYVDAMRRETARRHSPKDINQPREIEHDED